MLLGPGAVIAALGAALMLNPLLKIAVTAIVAPIAIRRLVYPPPAGDKVITATLIIAAGGSLAFHLPMWFPGGLLGLLLGIAAFWLVVTLTLDHYFDVHYDQSYAFTGQIVGASILLWLIIGAGLIFLSAAI